MSTGVDRARVERVFETALELPAAARAAYVADACAGDDALLGAVLALLQAHDRSGVLEVEARSLMTPDAVPERLGPYRVLREIGRGGMGIVYDGERDDGQFRRRVAIKIIRGDSDAALRARVLAERQILAALDHPNIARLLDGGLTPDGRPYLVMEHVDGLPIDVYCDRMRLTVAERLRLFLVVARAVDFAHHNLVVHRDLKPSNIMVTPDGRVKLLDFGVAKLLNATLSGAAVTREQLALTPEYASPEQLRNEGLTTTTDVYSLGVVLYELLTGRRPYSAHESSLAALIDAVCGEAAERPSTRVLRTENITTGGHERALEPASVARARQAAAPRLARSLRGDIDAITGKALRAEPLRRYGSAELMAQDIERHLEHRRVHAHEGSRRYALQKLLRRHRAQVVAAGLILIAVLLGAGAALWQAAAAERERRNAEAARLQSEQVTAFLLDLFETADQPTIAVTARDLVRRGTDRIDQLESQPLVQARVLGALGRIHESLGEFVEGQQATERALAAIEAEGLADDVEAAELLLQLGILQRRRGEYDSAQAAFFRARDIQQRLVDAANPSYARTLNQLASIAIYRGDFAEAQRRSQEAFELQRRALGEEHRITVNSLTQLGTIQRARGNFADAEQTLRRAVDLRARSNEQRRAEVLNDRFQLASLLMANSSGIVEAESMFRSMLPSLREEAPDDVGFVVWGKSNLADILEQRGDFVGAEQLLREILTLRVRVHGPEHPATAESLLALGGSVLNAGRPAEARQILTESANLYRRALGDRHPAYAMVLMELGRAALQLNALSEADSLAALAAAIRSERYGQQSHGYSQALRLRADVQIRLGGYEFAERLLLDALEQTLARTGGAPSSETSALRNALADLYTAWGRPADAARVRAEG